MTNRPKRNVFISFGEPIIEARFIARRKRFLADMELADGSALTALCPNTGSMKSCLYPGGRSILWNSQNEKRKLLYTWKAIKAGRVWVGLDTGLPNELAARAIEAGLIKPLSGYENLSREKKMGEHSRVDILLEGKKGRCWVEVKNVSLVEKTVAMFPDSVTSRGLKHLRELSARVAEGDRAAMVYVVQRADGHFFRPAAEIDPEYATGLARARDAGVEIYVIGCTVSPKGVRTRGLLPFSI